MNRLGNGTGISLVLVMMIFGGRQAVCASIGEQDTDLPRASSLRGRELPTDLAPPPSPIVVRRVIEARQPEEQLSSTNPTIAFQQSVRGLRIAGTLRVVKTFTPVAADLVKNIEAHVRERLTLPDSVKSFGSTSTAACSFTVLENGEIVKIEQERSTGSPALDRVIPTLLDTILPVTGASRRPLLRLRLTVTFNPELP